MVDCAECPPAKRSRTNTHRARSLVDDVDDDDDHLEWDAWWEEVHDGLGWGCADEEDVVTFRNDILPYTDTVSEDAQSHADRLVSVIQERAVVETRSLDLGLATLLVTAIVKAGRSVRHILVHTLPEHAHEWQQSQIDLHGEGGQIITTDGAHIPDRKLNARTLLIDEIGDKALQDKVTTAGGMVIIVGKVDVGA
jgi:hypothetical protein